MQGARKDNRTSSSPSATADGAERWGSEAVVARLEGVTSCIILRNVFVTDADFHRLLTQQNPAVGILSIPNEGVG